jgi:hypothetical protein
MARQTKAHPGGYSRKRLTNGVCYCCEGQPIAKGNLRLCTWCYRDEWDAETRPDPHRITEEDVRRLTIVVNRMELEPPTSVKHFSCDDYSQEQLREILNGGDV